MHTTIVILGSLVALSVVAPSFQVSDLIKLLGIGTVAIGFAFQNILQNFLAGILLLKPVFGQTITATPSYSSVVIQSVAPGRSNSCDTQAPEAKPLTPNYPLHLVWIAVFAVAPAAFDKSVQVFSKHSAPAN